MKKYIFFFGVLSIILGFSSCNNFLDEEPLSQVIPEAYFSDASQLEAYANEIYNRVLPASAKNSYGIYARDCDTDNQIGITANSTLYEDNQWKTSQNGGNWSFETIYRLNFFFNEVLPRYEKKEIAGDDASIKHYIGEMYFLRAYEYFNKLQEFGDFPIIKEPLPDNLATLTEASKRQPCNEVARFIIQDLDSAALMMNAKDMATTRINRDVAILFKSRVALYEGTWLKYFKGTPFVPNGEGWPGSKKEYNKNYQYPSGNIDNEILWFLDKAMESSKEVAEKYKNSLTTNTGSFQNDATEEANPYYDMYTLENMSGIKEIMLWRQYGQSLLTNDIALAAVQSNWGVGLTRSYVQDFLMADGTPVYKHGTYADGDGYYMGDKIINNVKINRDSRLSIFLKCPGENNLLKESISSMSNVYAIEQNPNITATNGQQCYTTGYALRKGGARDNIYCQQNNGYIGAIIFRSVEALLNYIEASYERQGTLDASATEYWKVIRQRACVSDDINKTINLTEMDKEAENDWGAYSAGILLTDKILYNIRRERRCEMLSEGLRSMDLHRWRAMDQLMIKRYIPEGMHLYNSPMESWYEGKILADGSSKSNMSSNELSEYIRPYQKLKGALCYNGFTWHMAHYLSPIPYKQFQLTAPDGQTISESTIYQNPYWPLAPSEVAEK